MHEVTIPKLGLTMTEGTIAQWSHPSGTEVVKGDVLFVMVTDKVEAEIEAEAEGVLHHAVPEGTTAPCGAVVAWLAAPGETVPVAPAVTTAVPATAATAPVELVAATANGGRHLSSPNARRLAADSGIDITTLTGSGPDGAVLAADVERVTAPSGGPVEPTVAPVAATASAPVGWTPVARRLADRLGIDGANVSGTGPGGRITLDDVIAAAGAGGAHTPVAPPATTPHLSGGRVPMAGMRKVIADRMHASLRDAAQLTMGTEVEVDALLALRAELKASWSPAGIAVPTVTDLLAKAVALALHHHPRVNAMIDGDAIVLLPDVHLGIAVDVDEGLVVPVVRYADLLGLDELAAETARLGTAAREGRLSLDEMTGSTFTISNLGTMGIDFFTPILNTPNVAILGVGRTKAVGEHQVLTLSLTIDHRALDGAPAARFLATLRGLVEAPHRLLASA